MRSIGCLVMLLALTFPLYVCAQEIVSWTKVSDGIGESEVFSVGVAPWNPQEVYAGTATGAYKTMDRGAHWKKVLSTKGDDRTVYCVTFSAKDRGRVYLGTGNGIYRSDDDGKHWKQIWKGSASGQKSVFWIETASEDTQQLYAATSGGLIRTQDAGKDWNRITTLPAHMSLRKVICDPSDSSLWVLADSGIFSSSDEGKTWERIWVSPAESDEETVESTEDLDVVEEFHTDQKIHCILLRRLQNRERQLLAGGGLGLLAQRNGGMWEAVPPAGLNLPEVQTMMADSRKEGALFLGTSQGVYYWSGEQNRLEFLSSGITAQKIHQFASTQESEDLWLASDGGVYRTPWMVPQLLVEQTQEPPNFLTPYELIDRYRHEPAIEQVHRWAIHHAEVEPEKIERWRRQAARKAWLPNLTFGMDRNTTDLWHWEGGSTTKVDDDILHRGRASADWNVNVSWNLGALIWSVDQTSIDVRSKLMVQLRDDILDEATRLYFERRRLQVEQELSPTKDIRLQVAQELRLQELTAQINGLTGGEFSRRLEQK